MNEFPSTACVGIGGGCSFGRVGGELQELKTHCRQLSLEPSACVVCYIVQLYNVVDIVVVCCSVACVTLVVVSV